MESVNGILLASDGSEHANKAALHAGELARGLNAKVEIITVHSNEILNIQLLGVGAWPGGVPVSSVSVEEIKTNVEASAQQEIFDPAIKALGALNTPVSAHQYWGHAGEVICERTSALGCNLIVMGSRGRSTFVKIMMGSVTMQVLNHASCPVTVVK